MTKETLDRDFSIRHADHTTEELDVLVIQAAVEFGFDPRSEAYELFAAEGMLGDPDDLSDEERDLASYELRYVADDAVQYLNEYANPDHERFWIGHDGYAGYFGVWLVDGLRECDECGRVTDAGEYPDWPDGVCETCDPGVLLDAEEKAAAISKG